MEIKKGILISVSESDLENGVFYNDTIIELGEDCFVGMKSLVKLILPKCLKINSSIRDNAALTFLSIGKIKLNVKTVDRECFVVEGEKTTKGIKVYSGYNFVSFKENKIEKEQCFVAEKESFFAHGETIKKAISDLQFKIVAEKLKKDPIDKDTLLTVNYYRLITGSCDLGVRSWMKSNGLEYEVVDDCTVELNPIKAIELLPLLEKSNAYGLEKFKSLINFK